MKKYIYFAILLFGITLVSCTPRVEMDPGQWGDNAFIENVQLFKLEIQDDVKLQEWYENGTVVTGVRHIVISEGVDINRESFTVNVVVPSEESLSRVGIKFWHKATRIEPLDGSPKAGTVNDFSSGTFKYRLHSADGTVHDWTINLVD